MSGLRCMRLSLLTILSLGLLVGCSKKEAELVGFGIYKLGSTLADVPVPVCRPDDGLTYCSNNPSPRIANHKTHAELYYRGHAEDAPLVEILVAVWSCEPGAVSADLHGKLGEPSQVGTKRALWKRSKMTVIALLPRDKELCTVHFLDPGETERIAELFAGD